MNEKQLAELAKSIGGIGVAFDAFKATNDDRLKALENGALRTLSDDVMDRIEALEAGRKMPGVTRAASSVDAEHKRRFVDWIRRPHDTGRKVALHEIEAKAIEAKAVNVTTPSDGGFAVPQEIIRDIERLEKKFSPVRDLVRVQNVGSGDAKALVSIRGASAGWVGEGGPRSETDTSKLRERPIPMGELYAYPQVSEWALDDVFFDVPGWLAEEAAQAFAEIEGDAVIRGNGTNQPVGMLDTTPTSAPDDASPLRAAAAYQFVPSLSPSSPAVAEVTGDALIDLTYSVNSVYRANATWVMNSTTAAKIRKLKDGNGAYVWAQGLAAGQPDMLLGYRVAIWEQMDDIGTNALPVAFGDFRRAYTLADRTALRVTVDSNITTPGKIKFFIRRRVGGVVTNNNAIKWLKTTIV